MDLLPLIYTQTATVAPSLPGGEETPAYLLTPRVYFVAAAIYLLPQLLRKLPVFKEAMANEWVIRFLPIYPYIAAFIMVVIPGVVETPNRSIETLIVATVHLAALSAAAYKFIGQTILGDDPRISTMAVVSPGQYEPVLKEGAK